MAGRNPAGDPPRPASAFPCATRSTRSPLGRKLARWRLVWALLPHPLLGRAIHVRYRAVSNGHVWTEAVTVGLQRGEAPAHVSPGQRHTAQCGTGGQGQDRTADLPLFSRTGNPPQTDQQYTVRDTP